MENFMSIGSTMAENFFSYWLDQALHLSNYDVIMKASMTSSLTYLILHGEYLTMSHVQIFFHGAVSTSYDYDVIIMTKKILQEEVHRFVKFCVKSDSRLLRKLLFNMQTRTYILHTDATDRLTPLFTSLAQVKKKLQHVWLLFVVFQNTHRKTTAKL